MKILITGSSGYVGNFLIKYLTSRGHEVIGLDTNQFSFQTYKGYNFKICDITNRHHVFSIIKDIQPDHIIHLAYLMKPEHIRAIEDSVDLLGSENIFLAANNTPSVKQLILFSSASVYGGNPDNPQWITEETKPRPGEWRYAQNKELSEEFYNNFPKREDLNIVIFRMCTACGPSYFKKGGLVRVLKHSPIGLLINGSDMNMQFIHEDDVKNLVERVLNDNTIIGTYNLAPDSFAATRELSPNPKLFIKIPESFLHAIFRMLWQLKLGPSPTSIALMTYSIIISPHKLQKRYNYTFKYSTKEAFNNSIE